ncbi:MAG TPA: sulfotransferase, partial [Gammaproteobacteria bacterium]
QALGSGVQHPAIHLAHGRLLLNLGRGAEALDALRASLQLDDRQPEAVALMGKALVALGRHREARQLLDTALALQPAEAPLREASGMAHMAMGHYEDAAREFERVLAAEPARLESYGHLATVYEQLNRLDDTRRVLEAGLVRRPEQPSLSFLAARLQRREDPAAARVALLALRDGRSVTAALDRDIEYDLGRCADALGQTDAAMAHFQAAKHKTWDLAKPAPGLEQVFPRQLASLKRAYGGEHVPVPGEAQKPMPAFLVGFPRSGTTLLDTMLGAHPALWVMEEQPTVQALLDGYLAGGLSYADDLHRLKPAQLAGLRGLYQRAARAAGWDGAKGLIDKSPFATVHLGLIQQVFPAAPVIFLARHPCDVVLSCMMSNFEVNSGTVHFARLDTTVKLYCAVMELWQLYRQRLPLHHHLLRYEDLVQQPETELRRLLDFLGLPWASQVLEHSAAAARRGRITTPSYDQVSRPLYQDARDRWRRYARYLEPHLPALAPHIQAFGYDG